jgi:hypothetical protein
MQRPPAGTEPGLVAAWRLDDGGPVAADAATPPGAARKRDGTLVTTSWRDAVRPLETSPDLAGGLFDFLDDWRLLTTRLSVIGYQPLPVTAAAKIFLADDGEAPRVGAAAAAALEALLDPLTGGVGAGWPFGRSIFNSEIMAALDGLPGVEFVKDVAATIGDASRNIPGDDQQVIGVRLAPHELPSLTISAGSFTFFQRVGTKWVQTT